VIDKLLISALLTAAAIAATGSPAVSVIATQNPPRQDQVAEAGAEAPVTTSSGLVYQIVKRGAGPAAKSGQHVLIHETTALADGTVIYSTRTKDKPLKFLLGGKQAIDGVDEGVTGMQVGERRRLIVPPKLSKRITYQDGLSPDATLYYEIELVEIRQQ
jgi:FKBP-type peptidyl-prolyl cis-trans isomerase